MSPVQEFLDVMMGLRDSIAWSVRKGHGSFLTLEFGQPHLVIREPLIKPDASRLLRSRKVDITGDYHLWIQDCNWTIFHDKSDIACNEDCEETIKNGARLIDGQKLIGLSINISRKIIDLSFDLGSEIRISLQSEGYQLAVYEWRRRSLTLTGSGNVEIELIYQHQV